MTAEKPCNTCGQVKPLDGFAKNPKLKDGRRNDCKACRKAKMPVQEHDNLVSAIEGEVERLGKVKRREDEAAERLEAAGLELGACRCLNRSSFAAGEADRLQDILDEGTGQ